jgi:hypothetical protein
MQLEIHEQRWKESTQSANKDFTQQRYDTALVGYRQALIIAKALLEEAITGVSAPPVRLIPLFVISCHNMAECYQRLHEPVKQLDCLEQAHQRILALCQDQRCPASLRQQCLCDLPKTLMPLVECLREQQPNRVTETVNHAKAVATQLLPPGPATPNTPSVH